MQKQWLALFEKSTITQSIITLIVVGGWMGMVYTSRPVPQLLELVVSLVIGFFFGAKVGHSAGEVKAIAKMRGELE